MGVGKSDGRGGYEPAGAPELEPDGGVPEPAGGVPVWVPEPLPMFGQFWVEPELELEPGDVLDEPELVPLEPEFALLELDDGVVVEELEGDELDVEPVPELPVVLDVVAALATSAPPARRPEVNAPMASTLRRRICMGGLPFRVV